MEQPTTITAKLKSLVGQNPVKIQKGKSEIGFYQSKFKKVFFANGVPDFLFDTYFGDLNLEQLKDAYIGWQALLSESTVFVHPYLEFSEVIAQLLNKCEYSLQVFENMLAQYPVLNRYLDVIKIIKFLESKNDLGNNRQSLR